jgi:hypothetical protein
MWVDKNILDGSKCETSFYYFSGTEIHYIQKAEYELLKKARLLLAY